MHYLISLLCSSVVDLTFDPSIERAIYDSIDDDVIDVGYFLFYQFDILISSRNIW